MQKHLIRKPTLFVLCLFLFSACSDKGPSLSLLSQDATILSFGDSLTFGTGTRDPETQSYPAILEKLIEKRVIKSGVPGETSAQGLKRLPSVLKKYKPDLVILCHGGNDLLQRKDLDQMKNNLREMIGLIRANNAQVVLLAVPKPGLFLKPEESYAMISEELGVPMLADQLSEILAQQNLKADTVHPNTDGYHKLAESLIRQLREWGAIK